MRENAFSLSIGYFSRTVNTDISEMSMESGKGDGKKHSEKVNYNLNLFLTALLARKLINIKLAYT